MGLTLVHMEINGKSSQQTQTHKIKAQLHTIPMYYTCVFLYECKGSFLQTFHHCRFVDVKAVKPDMHILYAHTVYFHTTQPIDGYSLSPAAC